jgi:hypothetical protein
MELDRESKNIQYGSHSSNYSPDIAVFFFFHIMSCSSGFISDVLLFKWSSVTLISIDNRSVTDAILCN